MMEKLLVKNQTCARGRLVIALGELDRHKLPSELGRCAHAGNQVQGMQCWTVQKLCCWVFDVTIMYLLIWCL